jgi:hypothetical protein
MSYREGWRTSMRRPGDIQPTRELSLEVVPAEDARSVDKLLAEPIFIDDE